MGVHAEDVINLSETDNHNDIEKRFAGHDRICYLPGTEIAVLCCAFIVCVRIFMTVAYVCV